MLPPASLALSPQPVATRLAELKAQGVAMIGVFHHPEDIQHLIDQEIRLTPLLEEIENVVD